MGRRMKAEQVANEIVIEAWRYACRLGRTSAERIAIYNTEMQRLKNSSAEALRQYARKRPLSWAAFAEIPSQKPRKRR